LIPKKDGVRCADGFRPISRQNCPMKLVPKSCQTACGLLFP
jgi:hypothetical protein